MPRAPKRQCVYIGIDPGQSGGLVSLSQEEVTATPMPATERDVWDWFADYFNPYRIFAVIEKVHSFPGQGVASTFKFGQNYGFLRGCLIAAGIPFEEVTPRVWQRTFSLSQKKGTGTSSQWKNRLKAKAQQLYPNIKVTLKTADALLITTYCKRKHEGLL